MTYAVFSKHQVWFHYFSPACVRWRFPILPHHTSVYLQGGSESCRMLFTESCLCKFHSSYSAFDKLLLNLNKTNVIWRWYSLVCCFFFFVLLPNVVYLLITENINGIMLIVINRCLIWIARLGVQLYCCMLDSIISFKCLNNPDCCWLVQTLKWDTALVVTVVTFANRILPETSKIEPSKKCPCSKQCGQFSRFRSPEESTPRRWRNGCKNCPSSILSTFQMKTSLFLCRLVLIQEAS